MADALLLSLLLLACQMEPPPGMVEQPLMVQTAEQRAEVATVDPPPSSSSSSGAIVQSTEIAALSPEQVRSRRDELIELLGAPDAEVRAAAAAALAYTARDLSSIPALVQALQVETDVGTQRRLVAVLASFSDQRCVDAIVRFWLGGVDTAIAADVRSTIDGADPAMVAVAVETHRAISPDRAQELTAR